MRSIFVELIGVGVVTVLVSGGVWAYQGWTGLRDETRRNTVAIVEHRQSIDQAIVQLRKEMGGKRGGCYDEAAAAFFFGAVALIREEDPEYVAGYIAKAVAFDPELAAMWANFIAGNSNVDLFGMLLQAKAWHGACPGGD